MYVCTLLQVTLVLCVLRCASLSCHPSLPPPSPSGQIVHQLEKNLKEDREEVEEALSKAFIHANTALMTTPIKYMTSGSTCVTMYMRGSTYWIANCGDSRAVMARRDGESLVAVDLSRDHKPDDPEEKARIEAWGGFVSPAPEPGLSARVWLDENYTMIGLAMGRSIGIDVCVNGLSGS